MRQALFVITDPDRRGAQVFASDLAASLRERGWDIQLVALAGGVGGLPDVDGLGSRRRSPATLRRLRRHIRAAAVVVGFGSTTLPMCALAGLGVATPFVYRSIGELDVWAPSGLKRVRTRLALRRAAIVVALWEAAREIVIVQFGVAPDRVVVIPRGVPLRPLPSADDRARARATMGVEGSATALFIGALREEKRPLLAVEAVARVPGLHLLVAGDGPLRPVTEALASRLAPGRVHFLGQVGDTTEVLRASDVLLLTSRTEGLPGVVLEAAAVGIPAVATSVGAVPEIVVHGRSGAVVPVDAAPEVIAEHLARSLEHSKAMGAAARLACFPRYDLQSVAASWSQLLDEVVASL